MKTGLMQSVCSHQARPLRSAKDLFRARFQSALRSCVRRRFSIAECFGVIWLETLEEIRLDDREQSELYEELIDWAKSHLFPEALQPHSPAGFTNKVGLRERCLERVS
jgi:hypothetical protein